jgi:hypothetical protein
VVEIAATLMGRYRIDELKSGEVSQLIRLLGKIGFWPSERVKMKFAGSTCTNRIRAPAKAKSFNAAILPNFCRYCSVRLTLVESSGDAMKQRDYERLAEQCSAQADAMQPGSERDALLTRAKQYRSYAKMEDWIASKELQPPVS